VRAKHESHFLRLVRQRAYLHAERMHTAHPNRLTFLGEAFQRRQWTRFGIKQADRRQPLYILGKTGMGKSTLLANIAIADIQAGEGLAVIDPHGALVEEILDYIPDERVDEVIYFNATDAARPVPFNPLAQTHPAHHALVASGIIAMMKKVWGDSWGPRLEHVLRYTLLTLLHRPGSTFLDVPRLLLDSDWRKRVVAVLQDTHLQTFWRKEFGAFSPSFRNEAVAPILNKVGQFVASPLMRNIVGQVENTFALREAMGTGKIVLVNLAKGRIGEDASALLGAMFVTTLWQTALSRQDIPEEERRDFSLLVDETHSIATASFADMLSETRKYRLNLTLAHQYLEQLAPDLLAAVLGNVGTLITFRTGAVDAEYLAREFYPVFTEKDLVNLPKYHVCLKLLIDGVPSRGFSAVTLPILGEKTLNKARVIERSQARYGRPPHGYGRPPHDSGV